MRLSFLVNHIQGGWKPDDTRLGGTEESVVEWAKELSNRGHKVDIYDNDNRDLYPGGYDACINVKSSDKPRLEPTIYFTNETDATDKDLSQYDVVAWPSQWAADNIPVNNKTIVIPHGYDQTEIYPGPKNSKQCFYASSPDRGLDTLLEAWPSVVRAHPDATLLLTYGAPYCDLPGVTNLGETTTGELNHIYRTSDIWCHPASGGELYAITGKKAQVAGCIPVIIPAMALKETVRNGYFATKENYTEVLIRALGTDNEQMRQKVIQGANAKTWAESTDILLQAIESVL